MARITGAHPRSRGEHPVPSASGLDSVGSSPLTRGARAGAVGSCGWRGLIPAHAGSTVEKAKQVAGGEAHPRSRGEHHTTMMAIHHRVGLIPAHAGSTPVAS